MKKIFALALVLMMALSTFGSAAFSPASAACVTTPQVVTLYAGQHIDVGTVTVDNDANNLYVTFTTSGDWWLQKTHLHVADSLAGIPTNKPGNPKIGNFAYQTTHDPRVQSYTYTIPKSALSLDENKQVVIAAHAEVVRIVDGEVAQSETGWGNGDPFVEKGSWAMYFSYTWQDCIDDPDPDTKTETAFARLLLNPYGTNGRGDDQVTCFLDLDTNGNNASRNEGDTSEISRWGWTNGALPQGDYEFELWAGAAQCDTNKGTLVGTVTLAYHGDQAVVTFAITPGLIDPVTGEPYEMTETHLYVGSEILARNNSDFTVAPGKYPTIHGELANVTSDSYTITGLSGDIYVVAHATVDGFPKPPPEPVE